ncbi:hypothetical protein BC567DRAFT_223424 [Phyllosticta citribraziliensis]
MRRACTYIDDGRTAAAFSWICCSRSFFLGTILKVGILWGSAREGIIGFGFPFSWVFWVCTSPGARTRERELSTDRSDPARSSNFASFLVSLALLGLWLVRSGPVRFLEKKRKVQGTTDLGTGSGPGDFFLFFRSLVEGWRRTELPSPRPLSVSRYSFYPLLNVSLIRVGWWYCYDSLPAGSILIYD